MTLHMRMAGDVAIVDNFNWVMNDPRHPDSPRDIEDALSQGVRKFIFEMRNVREAGDAFLGLLMTLTRAIRKHRGEVVIAHASHEVKNALDRMQLDDYWDLFPKVEDAEAFFHRGEPPEFDEQGVADIH